MLSAMEANKNEPTGLFSLLGHKGDLMIVHFRKSLDELNDAELRVSRSSLNEFLEPTSSYLSVVELGLYEASVKLYGELAAKGMRPATAEWNREVDAEIAKQ
jgi:chlorite dismutase